MGEIAPGTHSPGVTKNKADLLQEESQSQSFTPFALERVPGRWSQTRHLESPPKHEGKSNEPNILPKLKESAHLLFFCCFNNLISNLNSGNRFLLAEPSCRQFFQAELAGVACVGFPSRGYGQTSVENNGLASF